MDAARFDTFTRGLAAPASRRVAGRFLAGLGLAGLLALSGAAPAGAAKGRKGKKKKPKFNRFGCVNVGEFCKNSGQCCSGICSGRKHKKTCRPHDTGFLPDGSPCSDGSLGFCGVADGGGGLVVGFSCNTNADENGICTTTTGNAHYCAASEPERDCAPNRRLCAKDKDCEPFCGPGAACVLCPACGEIAPGTTRSCAGLAPDSCVF